MHSPSNSIRILGLCLPAARPLASPPLPKPPPAGSSGRFAINRELRLPAATVTITDTQRGISRSVTTDDAGGYVAPNLDPGIYTVRVEAKGFKTVERPNIQVEVATDLTVDLSLPPGDVTETVVVDG